MVQPTVGWLKFCFQEEGYLLAMHKERLSIEVWRKKENEKSTTPPQHDKIKSS
jgi:hypothetical protein